LRPGELGALRFEDFDGDHVNVGRSVWRTHVGTTKTSASAARMALTSQARKLFEDWETTCGNPSDGFLFQNASGKPLASTALTRPMKVAVGKRWKGFYSARRGMATILTEMTGDGIAWDFNRKPQSQRYKYQTEPRTGLIRILRSAGTGRATLKTYVPNIMR
jgi:integrase